jgi:hypothetical protein
MADYRIEPSATVIVYLSERARQRGQGPKPAIGAPLAFKSKYDTEEFVKLGEAEGYTFEGKEFLEESSTPRPAQVAFAKRGLEKEIPSRTKGLRDPGPRGGKR